MTFLGLWWRAFAITCAVEVPVVVFLLRRTLPWGRCLTVALVAQVLTHPAVWFILPELHLARPRFLALAESWAWLAEAGLYRLVAPTLPIRRALAISALANGLSWGVGSLLRDALN